MQLIQIIVVQININQNSENNNENSSKDNTVDIASYTKCRNNYIKLEYIVLLINLQIQ